MTKVKNLCKVIIKDDFNNILLVQKKAKRSEAVRWTIVSRDMKIKETEEKCITRAMKDDLKTIVFDLERLKDYSLEEENTVVYMGTIKERVTSNDKVEKLLWISSDELDKYEINDRDRVILRDFFE